MKRLEGIPTLTCIRSLVLIASWFTALLPFVGVAEVSVRSQVSPTSGTTDDIFVFTVTVSGAVNVRPPLLSGGDGFSLKLVGPHAIRTNINGVVSMETRYVYHLRAKSEGELQTPLVEVDTGSTSPLVAPPITVSVKKGATPSDDAGAGGDQNIYLRQTVSPESVFLGQQLVNTITLFTKLEVEAPQLADLTTDGFWQEEISNGETALRDVQGQRYLTWQVRRALFPLREGEIVLPARTLSAQVARVQSGFPLSGFGFAQYEPTELTSNSRTVTVRPLPPVPSALEKLAEGGILVGETSIKVDYSLDVIKVGESKTVSISVTSEGNINTLKHLTLVPPPGVKVYEEAPESSRDPRGSALLLKKVFRYTLVPLKPGLLRIPAVSILFFDPKNGEYRNAAGSDIAFAAQGVSQLPEEATPSPNRSPRGDRLPSAPNLSDESPPKEHGAVAAQEDDPLPLFEEPSFAQRVERYVSLQTSILFLAVAIGFATVLLVYRRVQASEGVGFSHFVPKIQAAATLPEIQQIYSQFLQSALLLPGEAPTTDQLRAALLRASVSEESRTKARGVLDEIERLLYSPEQSGNGENPVPIVKARVVELAKTWRV